MPNGADRNVGRLAMCVAAHRARYGAWPTHARLHPLILCDLAHVLGAQNFERIANRMELRTQWPTDFRLGISVGGASGVQWYEDVDYDRLPPRSYDEAADWLGLDRS